MNIASKISLFVLLFLGSGIIYSQNKNVVVSLLTCSPGSELYSIYGHNALRIQNFESGTDLVYNYGTFDFNTPGFALKFMRGQLPYLLSVAEYNDFMYEYNYFSRSVKEQILDIDSIATDKIVNFMQINMLPQNRAYKYDFFKDNCATRLRDVLDKNIAGLIWDTDMTSHKTYRQIIKEYQQAMPWTNFGIDLIIGAPADKPTTLAEEVFIPDYLAQALTNATVNQKKLQMATRDLLTFDINPSNPSIIFRPEFFFTLLFIIELFIFFNAYKGKHSKYIKNYDTLWVIIILLASLLMIFMWFGTDHIPTKYNWNILWANLLIPLWYFYGRYKRWASILAAIILVCLLITVINAAIQVLPQYFHPVAAIISLLIIIKGWRLYTYAAYYNPSPIDIDSF